MVPCVRQVRLQEGGGGVRHGGEWGVAGGRWWVCWGLCPPLRGASMGSHSCLQVLLLNGLGLLECLLEQGARAQATMAGLADARTDACRSPPPLSPPPVPTPPPSVPRHRRQGQVRLRGRRGEGQLSCRPLSPALQGLPPRGGGRQWRWRGWRASASARAPAAPLDPPSALASSSLYYLHASYRGGRCRPPRCRCTVCLPPLLCGPLSRAPSPHPLPPSIPPLSAHPCPDSLQAIVPLPRCSLFRSFLAQPPCVSAAALRRARCSTGARAQHAPCSRAAAPLIATRRAP